MVKEKFEKVKRVAFYNDKNEHYRVIMIDIELLKIKIVESLRSIKAEKSAFSLPDLYCSSSPFLRKTETLFNSLKKWRCLKRSKFDIFRDM